MFNDKDAKKRTPGTRTARKLTHRRPHRDDNSCDWFLPSTADYAFPSDTARNAFYGARSAFAQHREAIPRWRPLSRPGIKEKSHVPLKKGSGNCACHYVVGDTNPTCNGSVENGIVTRQVARARARQCRVWYQGGWWCRQRLSAFCCCCTDSRR